MWPQHVLYYTNYKNLQAIIRRCNQEYLGVRTNFIKKEQAIKFGPIISGRIFDLSNTYNMTKNMGYGYGTIGLEYREQ